MHAGSKVLTALGLRLRSAQEHSKSTNPSSPQRRARGLLLRSPFAGACLALIVRTAACARARHSNALLPSGPRAHYRCHNSIGALPSLPRLLPAWLARAWLLAGSRIERANQPVCTPLPLASLINCRTLCATKGKVGRSTLGSQNCTVKTDRPQGLPSFNSTTHTHVTHHGRRPQDWQAPCAQASNGTAPRTVPTV